MTVDELKSKGLIEECPIEPQTINGVPTFRLLCEEFNEDTIEEYKQSKPAEPARDWYEKASDKEYSFCIRSKGLTK